MITKPPGWPFLTAISAVGIMLLYWASVPHWYTIEMFLTAVFAGGPLVLIWGVRIGTAALKDESAVSGRLWRWFLPWLIAAGVVVALVADLPFRMRFAVSEPSMEAFSRTVAAGTSPDDSCRWLGLYRVCWADRYFSYEKDGEVPGSAAFSSEEWAIYSNTGFVWLPEGRPEETSDDSYRHLGGSWYGWQGWDKW
ncbi:hypothetical protein [Streptosporangium pseudovulgare]|uniref:DUF1109 domain-containing protein n=1 Tax=Streptosporangium pseudovulgare TaxID=35765 RepID=A0ABQ2RBQ4_9ACTN|nr:hypothetical protein [Streptosporangium pseudovulgare]GGQ23776.1 hypothetical protein GCM10010140_62590 [Streptosporangium pseudovulgare]